jgi:hypothetical protein
MGFKGIYSDKSSSSKIGILFLLIFVSLILHTLLAIVFINIFTDHAMSLVQSQDISTQTSVNYLKLMQLFSGIGLFITPMLFYSYLTNFDFKLNRISRQSIILVTSIMMLITPFVALLLEWNMQIPLPEWLVYFDVDSENLVVAFLKMSTIWDLFYTLLVISIVPAIGEELLFRGYLQQKTIKWLRNPHMAILITAFLFSAIHLDFHALIPRFILGILLGYLYYWSGSLYLPILAHFVNNAQAVVFSFPLFKVESGAYSIFSESKVDSLLGLFSFGSVVPLLYVLYQNLSIKKG